MKNRNALLRSLKLPMLIWALLATNFNKSQAQGNSYREEIHITHDGPVYLTGDRLRFSITCLDQSNHLLSPLSRLAYVELLDSENIAISQLIIDLQNGKGKGDIMLPFTASSGNYVLRAYTKWMQNFPPEEYAYSIISIVNPFKSLGLKKDNESSQAKKPFLPSSNLTISTSKEVYRNRDKVSLEIALSDVESRPVEGSVSVSVSKIPGFIDDLENELSEMAVVIKPSSKTNQTKPRYLPETKGQFLTGQVFESGTNTPKPSELIYLSITGVQPEFYSCKSDSEGRIRFEIVGFYGKGRVHLQSSDFDSEVDIVLDTPFSEEFAVLDLPPLSIDEKWTTFLTQASQNMQVRNVYSSVIPYDGHFASTDSLPFYGIPDQQYYLDDYTRFPLMEEVLREYVAGILPRKKDNEFYFKMVNIEKNEVMVNEPLMLYDGLPIKRANTIMELNPRLIKRIDIINKRYLMGSTLFDGITSFHSYKGDLAGLDKALIVGDDYDFIGVREQVEYVFPDYSDATFAGSKLPDFRNTLYWNDNTMISNGKATVDFFTGDDTGTYLIDVNGISESGELISQKMFLKVEK